MTPNRAIVAAVVTLRDNGGFCATTITSLDTFVLCVTTMSATIRMASRTILIDIKQFSFSNCWKRTVDVKVTTVYDVG